MLIVLGKANHAASLMDRLFKLLCGEWLTLLYSGSQHFTGHRVTHFSREVLISGGVLFLPILPINSGGRMSLVGLLGWYRYFG